MNTTSSKNEDTLVGLKDDSIFNDIYFAYQLPDFILGARLRVPYRAIAAQVEESEEHDLDTDVPPTPEDSLVSEGLM